MITGDSCAVAGPSDLQDFLQRLDDDFASLSSAHPPDQAETQATTSFEPVFRAAQLQCLAASSSELCCASAAEAIERDPLTGLPIHRPATDASGSDKQALDELKTRYRRQSTLYRRCLMGKAVHPTRQRPPPFHNQVNAFGKRAQPPMRGYRNYGFQYVEVKRAQPPATSRQAPAQGSGAASAQAAAAPPAKPAEKECPLCHGMKPAHGGSRYCRACESLRWECRKVGVKMPALRLAITEGAPNVVKRAVELQAAAAAAGSIAGVTEHRAVDNCSKSSNPPALPGRKVCALCTKTFDVNSTSSGAASSYCRTCEVLRCRIRGAGYTLTELRCAMKMGHITGIVSTDVLKQILSRVMLIKSGAAVQHAPARSGRAPSSTQSSGPSSPDIVQMGSGIEDDIRPVGVTA